MDVHCYINTPIVPCRFLIFVVLHFTYSYSHIINVMDLTHGKMTYKGLK